MLIHLHPTRRNTKEYRNSLILNTRLMANVHSENVVVNGTFTGSANGWVLGAGWAYAANRINATAATTNAVQYSKLSIGRYYRITFTATVAGGTVRVYAGETAGTLRTANGTYTEVLKCVGNTNLTFDAVTAFTGTVDTVIAEVTDFEYLNLPESRRGGKDYYSVEETDNYIVAIANQTPVSNYVNVPVYYEFDPLQGTTPTDFLIDEVVSCQRAPAPYQNIWGNRSVLKVNHKGRGVVEYLINMHYLDILGLAHTGSTSTTTSTTSSTSSTSTTSTCTTYSTTTSTSSTSTTSTSTTSTSSTSTTSTSSTSTSSTSTSSTSTSSTSTTSTSSTSTTSTSTTSTTTPGYRP